MGGFSEGSWSFDGCVPPLRGFSPTENIVLVWRDGSAWRAGILSFASPKESSQRKGDPRLRGRRCRLPCATRCWRGLRNSGLRPSDSPRPLSAISSVARRSTWGPGKTSRRNHQYSFLPSPCYSSLIASPFWAEPSSRDAFRLPMRGAEQRRLAGGFRLALSEPQASLASRPDNRVAQGTRVAGADPGVAFSLATFFWRSKRKYARPQGGTPSQSKPHSQNQRNQPC